MGKIKGKNITKKILYIISVLAMMLIYFALREIRLIGDLGIVFNAVISMIFVLMGSLLTLLITRNLHNQGRRNE